jgi:hypothetical protein
LALEFTSLGIDYILSGLKVSAAINIFKWQVIALGEVHQDAATKIGVRVVPP